MSDFTVDEVTTDIIASEKLKADAYGIVKAGKLDIARVTDSKDAFRKIHRALAEGVICSIENWDIDDAIQQAMKMREIEGHTDVEG